MSKEQLMQYTIPGPLWTKDTIRKHGWVLHLYEPFCEKLELAAFPIDETNGAAFIQFIALECGFKSSTLQVCLFYTFTVILIYSSIHLLYHLFFYHSFIFFTHSHLFFILVRNHTSFKEIA
jgi:hypothetical protein